MGTTEAHPRWLTIDQAANLTNLPKSFWYRLTNENRAPGLCRWGSRTLRIDRLELEKWMAAGGNNATH